MSFDQNGSGSGRGKNRWLILIGAVGVCFVIILWAYFAVTKQSPAPTGSAIPTVADTVAMLTGRGKVAFPAIVGASAITPAQLPQGVQTVFASSLNNMTISSLRYHDGRTGFLASVFLVSTLPDFYDQVVRGFDVAGWTVLYAARASSAAIYQAQNGAYTMQVLFTVINENHVRADIQIIGR
jgi:hypothetical protein